MEGIDRINPSPAVWMFAANLAFWLVVVLFYVFYRLVGFIGRLVVGRKHVD